jgi:hypothetical protein
MEGGMKTCLAAIAAILAVALMIPNSVNAGASASAPSKYAANHGNKQQADRQSYPITEYSSSVRHHPPKH